MKKLIKKLELYSMKNKYFKKSFQGMSTQYKWFRFSDRSLVFLDAKPIRAVTSLFGIPTVFLKFSIKRICFLIVAVTDRKITVTTTVHGLGIFKVKALVSNRKGNAKKHK